MSGTRLEIGRVGRVGSIVLDTEDVLQADRCTDGANAVTLTVRHRREYLEDDACAFKWGNGYDDLRLLLTARQTVEAVEQLRAAQKSFCTGEDNRGCYDFGKVEKAPAACLRCQLLQACHRSRMGDFRKVKPAAVERPRIGAITGVWILILALWFVCWCWATSMEALQRDLEGCRREEAKRLSTSPIDRKSR